MEMRELNGGDLFVLLAIVGKLDVKDEIVALFGADKVDATQMDEAAVEALVEQRGAGIIATLIQKSMVHLVNIKTDINALLADLTGATIEEIEKLGLAEYTNLLVSFFKKKELKDFFTCIASLISSGATAST